MEIKDLQIESKLNNEQLCEIFKVAPQGGMRRGTKTNSLVIISNHVKSLYEDRWENDVLYYTGMGTEGDQSINFGQNRTLYESPENNVSIYLFEVFKEKEYTFRGQVELLNKNNRFLTEKQFDSNGNVRNVVVFPLRLLSSTFPVIQQKELKFIENTKEKSLSNLSNSQLKEKAEFYSKQIKTHKSSSKRMMATESFIRNAYVEEWTKRRANGICELCGKKAPFDNKLGQPYLESHHVKWLSDGGSDSIDNTVALCPNCHRKMHILNLKEDEKKLKAIISKYVL